MKTVKAMATTETDTPMYPMTCNESRTGGGTLRGSALNRIAKCVRWSHSHTVKEVLEMTSFLEQPLPDHCPILNRSGPNLSELECCKILHED